MQHDKNQGFTVIELLVAISVFTVAMAMIVGVFIEIVKTQRIVNAMMEANSNASLMIEQMAREMRLGFSFATSSANGACPEGFGDTLDFIRYRRTATTSIHYAWNIASSTIDRREGTNATSSLTPGSISVQRLCFWINENESLALGDSPWRVTILAKITPNDVSLIGRGVDLQTTVSSRILPTEVQ